MVILRRTGSSMAFMALVVFFTALTVDLAIRGVQEHRPRYWLGCGTACATAMLLRPDGGLLLVATEAYLAAKFFFEKSSSKRNLVQAVLIVAIVSVLPLAPWAIRNWHVFHRFQPLAPRYANEENEFVPMGFNRWVKTWIADYVSVEEVYWAVPGSSIDVDKLPSRAFDTPRQRETTINLIGDYNQLLHISPAVDQRFA